MEYMFAVKNGVRQGGILSPLLFDVYMDDLTLKLNSLPVGCAIKGKIINNLMYADDVVLMSPSTTGLQKLVDICFNYGTAHNIVFNQTKTVFMHVKSKSYKWLGEEPKIYLGGC